jgi:hypothetical protein
MTPHAFSRRTAARAEWPNRCCGRPHTAHTCGWRPAAPSTTRSTVTGHQRPSRTWTVKAGTVASVDEVSGAHLGRVMGALAEAVMHLLEDGDRLGAACTIGQRCVNQHPYTHRQQRQASMLIQRECLMPNSSQYLISSWRRPSFAFVLLASVWPSFTPCPHKPHRPSMSAAYSHS